MQYSTIHEYNTYSTSYIIERTFITVLTVTGIIVAAANHVSSKSGLASPLIQP